MTLIGPSLKHCSLDVSKFDNMKVLCTYPVIPSFVHVCIYLNGFPLWLFLELDFLLWNIVLEVSRPFLQFDYQKLCN